MVYFSRALALGILLLFFALPSFSTNLWPIYQKNVYPFEEKEVDVLGPIFHYERSRDHKAFGVRPLFYWTRRGNSTTLEFLYPLGKVSRGAKEKKSFLIPLYRRQEEERKDVWFFPFFYGEKKGESFGGFFPIYGTLIDGFGWKKIEFVLWPIYTREEGEGFSLVKVLWPIFSFYGGGGASGIKFWPLFGSYHIYGKEKTSFFLWPLFALRDRYSGKEVTERRRFILFPIYSDYRSELVLRRTFLWPFISYTRSEGFRNFVQFDLPWPIIRVKEGVGENEIKLFPVFWERTSGSDKKVSVFWPLYKFTLTTYRKSFKRSHSFLLINRFSTVYDSSGNAVERSFNIWPFFYYYRKGSYTENYSLTLLPTRGTGFERLYAPFFHIFSFRSSPERSQFSILWGLLKGGRDEDGKGISLAWIFDFKKTSKGIHFSFLKGFFEITHTKDGRRRIKLFFIPITI